MFIDNTQSLKSQCKPKCGPNNLVVGCDEHIFGLDTN